MEDIRLYDFKKSEKFSIENIRYFVAMAEEFCKTSNMQISYETKSDNFKLDLEKSSQTNFGEFIEKVNSNNVVVEYRVYPLVENLTIFFDKHVVLSLVDSLLGGSGKIDSIDRELTNIDLELFKYLAECLLRRIYIPYHHENINIVDIYTNTVQYQKLTNKDVIFEAALKVALQKESLGMVRFCMPYKNMESVLGDLVNNNIKGLNRLDEEGEKLLSKEALDFTRNVDVDICAKLGGATVSINDLLNLEAGDVILLDQRIYDDITISVGDADVYKAKAGLLGIKKGVEITDIIDKER
ncbi:FliM/FliN family flagellar motor switch protein [Clostridium culturomicium]|uniref:FliM/FliN family flagellar motor switch protein n=1 Tax=Clostridium culturomicium TaxID=1499683 RepID=UPI0006933BFA|nr:FliM/FliN family flagellar motor switch protein [Clostridium culturomicium]